MYFFIFWFGSHLNSIRSVWERAEIGFEEEYKGVRRWIVYWFWFDGNNSEDTATITKPLHIDDHIRLLQNQNRLHIPICSTWKNATR